MGEKIMMLAISEFFYMGGYAEYVWPAYLITIALLAINIILPIVKKRQVIKRITSDARQS